MNQTVVVGMSGGVDSSFAAARLKEEGYDVIGIMLNLWSVPGREEHNRCCAIDSLVLARRVAAMLEIPFYAVDARDLFRETVVAYFINEYNRGATPNPCVLCNARVRWKMLLDQADKLDAGWVATGHYARMEHNGSSSILERGVDEQKDQSFVLSMLPKEYLSRTILPVGNYRKPEVRAASSEWKLPTAHRPDSQDLCFLGDMDYRQFLNDYTSVKDISGEVVLESGEVIGVHPGLRQFTIGQRRGLRIAYKVPLYVLEKNFTENKLVVGPREKLEKTEVILSQFNWLLPAHDRYDHLRIKVRYSAQLISCTYDILTGGNLAVHLQCPSTEISSGQVAALYAAEICLGGGIIV